MPRRPDLRSICVLGAGPIVIGQACEFDYAGCQALKVLRTSGYRTIVVNSNPATIMTDPGFADRTYVEPLDVEGVAEVLAREAPHGQRAQGPRASDTYFSAPRSRVSSAGGATAVRLIFR